jgi:hypothetical protein
MTERDQPQQNQPANASVDASATAPLVPLSCTVPLAPLSVGTSVPLVPPLVAPLEPASPVGVGAVVLEHAALSAASAIPSTTTV